MDRLKERLSGIEQEKNGSFMALCPAHDDGAKSGRASLHVTEAEDGTVLLKCFAGCSADAILAEIGEGYDILFPENAEMPKSETKERSWKIYDTDGKLFGTHVRYEYPDGSKDFRWRGGLNGRSSKEAPLYGAELIPSFDKRKGVVLVEGEKAADALRALGFQCVASVTGSGTAPLDDVLDPLTGFSVVLWPDADEGGRAHMEKIGRSLSGKAARVSAYQWPGAGPKQDAADHPAASGDEMEIKRLGRDLGKAVPFRSGLLWQEESSRGSETFTAVHIGAYSDELEKRRRQRMESEDGIIGIRSPLPDLDEYFAGWLDESSYVVGADTGTGKSILMGMFGSHASEQGKMVLVVSTEMSGRTYLDRLEHYYAGIPTWKARKGQYTEADLVRLREAHERLLAMPLYFDDTGSQTITKIKANIEMYQPDMVIVDHIQNMKPERRRDNDSRSNDLGGIVQSIIELKREYKVAVLMASQLSRASTQRSKKEPMISDLRDSGEIEEGQDGIIMPYRPARLDMEGYSDADIKIKIAKNREGPLGTIDAVQIPDQAWIASKARYEQENTIRIGESDGAF